MEFKQDGTGQWKRRKLNNTNEFKIITAEKNIIPIPNFIDTRRKFKKRKGLRGGQSWYHRHVIPLYRNHGHYYCNIFTGQWRVGRCYNKILLPSFNQKIRKIDKVIAERHKQIHVVLTDFVLKDLICIICEFVNL